MRKKKLAIIIVTLTAFILPLSAFATVSFLSTKEKVSSSYIFKPDSPNSIMLKEQVSKALDNTIGENAVLDLKFDTLTKESQYTAAQNAWFLELTSALKWIDPRINFEKVPRSNASLERAHYNGDTIAKSFFWGPDYNNIGTWMGFSFSGQFSITNLYPSLVQYSEDYIKNLEPSDFIQKDFNGSIMTPDYQTKKWLPDLAKYLSTFKIKQEYIDFYNISDDKVPGIPVLDALAPQQQIEPVTKYLYTWEELEGIDKAIQIGAAKDGKIVPKLITRDTVWNQIGYWSDLKTSEIAGEQYWLGLLSWMNQQGTVIPWISVAGAKSNKTTLARAGLKPVLNPYANNNYRDWYFDDPVKDNAKNSYTHWSAGIPYESTMTPFNPNFSRSPNYMYFQSTWNGLIDYKTVGDWTTSEGAYKAPGVNFYLQGAKSIDLRTASGTLLHTIGGKKPLIEDPDYNTWMISKEDLNHASDASIYEFQIPRLNPGTIGMGAEWFNKNKESQGVITAQDYFAGLLAFLLSSKWNYNTNGYYTSLINLDIEKTLKANSQFFSNKPKPGESYSDMDIFKMRTPDSIEGPKKDTFTIVQSVPNVNTLDIMSKSYFQPLPSQNQKVKYIFENSAEFLENGSVNEQSPGFKSNVYGGYVNEDISEWFSSGPYILTNAGIQEMVFQKNDSFFERFPLNFFGIPSESGSMLPKDLLPKTQLKQIILKFGRGYSVQTTYEGFKANETDISEIPQANLSDAFITMRDDVRSTGIDFVPRTDLISFNTEIYQVDQYGLPMKDSNGNKIRKPSISWEYEKAIVEDLYKGKNGNSYKLRQGILGLVDWYSLASLATPTDTPYYQNSIIPFGNAKIGDTTFFNNTLEIAPIGFSNIKYSDYVKNWESQIK